MGKDYSRMSVKQRGNICLVTIHRPLDRNSIDTQFMKELDEGLGEIEKTNTRAVIFTGAGETYFIGGA
ncbi:MAG: enoyl-CoA hydratase-related protein, partial [Deltaproteobacteria bacterium]|nr:enoyl-CoA hydratase-related protein [Deltaproteobacteria bacterium]